MPQNCKTTTNYGVQRRVLVVACWHPLQVESGVASFFLGTTFNGSYLLGWLWSMLTGTWLRLATHDSARLTAAATTNVWQLVEDDNLCGNARGFSTNLRDDVVQDVALL